MKMIWWAEFYVHEFNVQKTLWGKYYYDPVPYADEETESKRLEVIYRSVKSNQAMELRNE